MSRLPITSIARQRSRRGILYHRKYRRKAMRSRPQRGHDSQAVVRRKRTPHPSLAIGFSLALLTVPILVSCGSGSSRTVSSKPPPATPPRTITFRGLDNDYRGHSTVESGGRVLHRRNPDE